MLSYQHKYHVGNHADVLKHLCWLSAINYLNKKDKPYTLIDTHAGEGVYAQANTDNKERKTGIDKLHDTQGNALLTDYLSLLSEFQQAGKVPGSPALTANLMRPCDAMHCIELHPQAAQNLRRFANLSSSNIHCHTRDAFEGLNALVPPKVKRGAILIDPPYEQIKEYLDVRNACTAVLSKWPSAQLFVWLPLLGSRAPNKANAANKIIEFCDSLDVDVVKVSLTVQQKADAEGMYGSVMLAINPYWLFGETLSEVLPIVCRQLGENSAWSVN